MNTGAGRHTFRILLSNAQYESDMISERVRKVFTIKRQLGSNLKTLSKWGFENLLPILMNRR